MILTCPECATSYFTADDAIGPAGRRVRCQSCAHTWRAMSEEPLELVKTTTTITVATPAGVPAEPASFGKRDEAESLAETPAPELPKAYRARAEQQRRLRRAAAHGVVWAGLASVFVGLLGAGWLFRVEVVELYPRAAAAYAFVGSPVNPIGLEFEAVSAKPAPTSPGMVLISGAVRNVRDNEIVAPAIRVALLNAQGREIGHQLVEIDGAPVLPGGLLGFATLAPDPHAEAADIGVSFAPRPAPAPVRRQAPVEAATRTVARPVPVDAAPSHGLRGAVEVGYPNVPALEPVDAQPIEGGPAETATGPALDNAPGEAVSASHHG